MQSWLPFLLTVLPFSRYYHRARAYNGWHSNTILPSFASCFMNRGQLCYVRTLQIVILLKISDIIRKVHESRMAIRNKSPTFLLQSSCNKPTLRINQSFGEKTAIIINPMLLDSEWLRVTPFTAYTNTHTGTNDEVCAVALHRILIYSLCVYVLHIYKRLIVSMEAITQSHVLAN